MSERWSEMDDVDLMQLEAEMHGELQDLREAVTVYADRAWSRKESVAVARPAARRGWMTWATAAVAAAALAAGGLRVAHRDAVTAVHDASAAQTSSRQASPMSDEALLNQIQSDLSSGVPAAMQPLEASDAHRAQDVVKR